MLDLPSNRYYALTHVSGLIWKELEAGEPVSRASVRLAQVLDISKREAADLIVEQISIWHRFSLVSDENSVSCLLPRPRLLRHCGPTTGLDPQLVDRARLWPSSIVTVLLTDLRYRHYLRRYGLARCLLHIGARRNDTPSIRQSRDPDLMLSILKAYAIIRRVYWERQNDCVARSLGLTASLRRNGIDARFTIGVTMLPFRAHAWVQVADMVLNDRLSLVRQFRPLVQF